MGGLLVRLDSITTWRLVCFIGKVHLPLSRALTQRSAHVNLEPHRQCLTLWVDDLLLASQEEDSYLSSSQVLGNSRGRGSCRDIEGPRMTLRR